MSAVQKQKNKYKPILIKNILLSFVAYHIGIAISLLANLLDIDSIQLTELAWLLYLVYIPHILLFIYVARVKSFTKPLTTKLLALQIIWWLVVFAFWDFYVASARPLVLILSFLAIHYLFLYTRFIYSILVSSIIAVVHLFNSYIGINYYNQVDSFPHEVLFTLAFLFSSGLISFHSITVSSKVLRAAAKDDLTRLYNRRYFGNVLEEAFNRCKRYGHPCSLLLIDIDAFKSINDRLGHSVGDQVLMLFSDSLKEGLRDCDLACRWGGEEFLIILPHTDEASAMTIAKRLLAKISLECVLQEEPDLEITFSGGVCLLNSHSSPEAAIIQADNLMYQAKHKGRNQIICETLATPPIAVHS